MKVKQTIVIEKDIDRCWNTCPYFTTEGMERLMVCNHPDAPSPYIISHPDCDDGFPKLCPIQNNVANNGNRKSNI